MATVKNPQFLINIRKNENTRSLGYGKYYPKAVEKATISLRGLCKHMSEHNSIYGRDIIEGVLTKMVSCITELISEGNPVKLDGLGIFYPTVESKPQGITKAAIINGDWNAETYVKAVHIRFRPEGTAEDNITSRAFKGMCALTTNGVEERFVISGTGTEQDPYVYGKRVTPLADWIQENQGA